MISFNFSEFYLKLANEVRKIIKEAMNGYEFFIENETETKTDL